MKEENRKGTLVEDAVKGINRRNFLKGAAVSALSVTSLGMLAGCSPLNKEDESANDAKKVVYELPDREGKLTLEELNALRQQYVDSKEEYVCEDGTVIPAVYVKLRALINTYGNGAGSEVHDASFNEVMYLFSEKEAQAYLEMPFGVRFTATDFSVKSGRDETDCLKLCEDLAARGLLKRLRRGGVAYFHHLAPAHGIWEYVLLLPENQNKEYVTKHKSMWGADIVSDLYDIDTPFYYPIPVDKEIVVEDEVLSYDDYEKIVARNEVIAVSTCQCRLGQDIDGSRAPDCDHPMETCITTGEQAEFYIENGIGRQIDQEEALKILRHSVEVGMVLQSCHTSSTEVICSCHGDCCDVLKSYVALGENYDKLGISEVVSHYELQYNRDECVKCRLCEPVCPMFAITMDDEGYSVTGSPCISCGQCATVCPAGARKLVQREGADQTKLPGSLLDDYNLKASYRFKNNMIS
ncbi:MAG TPA: 4Fe-4S binding protein [Oscillospiraceae bacterium]|nr:4Fe-4S binding protein [Oscillospiraceae bacterium]